MASDVTRAEFDQLEARVTVVEREVEGEKLVTRHVLEQTRRNSDDLAAIKTRLARMEHKSDDMFSGLERKVGALDQKVSELTKKLPAIVAETMREVLRERDGK
jgi:predicted  nucleic acid-binding Zn-ribbon protein